MPDQITSPLKAIRAKCIVCCLIERQISEVKLCPSVKCPLHPFRMGKNPFRAKREYTDEQRATMAERLSKIRRQKQGENRNDSEDEETID